LDRSAAVAVPAETTAAPTQSLESSFFTEQSSKPTVVIAYVACKPCAIIKMRNFPPCGTNATAERTTLSSGARDRHANGRDALGHQRNGSGARQQLDDFATAFLLGRPGRARKRRRGLASSNTYMVPASVPQFGGLLCGSQAHRTRCAHRQHRTDHHARSAGRGEANRDRRLVAERRSSLRGRKRQPTCPRRAVEQDAPSTPSRRH
jgi:hypothetical protein